MQAIDHKKSEFFLLLALLQVKEAMQKKMQQGLIGFVVVQNEKILSKGSFNDVTCHDNDRFRSNFSGPYSQSILFLVFEDAGYVSVLMSLSAILKTIGFVKIVYSHPNIIKKSIKKKSFIDFIAIPLEEISFYYKSYLIIKEKKKLLVHVSQAQSLDGKIALKTGPVKLTSQLADDYMHKKRLIADVIITTAKTVISDNPKLNARLYLEAFAKPIAIFDTNLQLSGNEQLFELAQEVHIFFKKGFKGAFKKRNVYFHAVDEEQSGGLAIDSVFNKLYEMGFSLLWVEAGERFTRSLYEKNLVDTTFLFIAPKILGDNGIDINWKWFGNIQHHYSVKWQILGNDVLAKFDWNLDEEGG